MIITPIVMIARNIMSERHNNSTRPLSCPNHCRLYLIFPVLFISHVAFAQNGGESGIPADATFIGTNDLSAVKITEIMYHPPDQGALVGDLFEFIEIKNTGTEDVNLSGVIFTNGIDYSFPGGTMLASGAFIVLVTDVAAFYSMYGFYPVGIYLGRLNNAGERVTLSDQTGAELVTVRYNDRWPWPLGADGIGFSLVLIDPNANVNPDDPAAWQASSRIGGTPGYDDPATGRITGVLITEVLTHTDNPQQDAIELFNPTTEAANIGGWFITDDRDTPFKYRIPSGTVLPAGGYIVYYENHFNPNPGVAPSFSFSSKGESVYLFSADAETNLTGYLHGFSFSGAETGVSFGRYINSIGEEQFPPQLGLSLGNQNVGPEIGEVVISELMYHPPDGDDEFIELFNRSDDTVLLYDTENLANTWEIGGVNFVFPEGTALLPSSTLLVVGTNPTSFRSKYNIPETVQIVGPFAGLMSNASETIRIQRPDTPELDGTYALITVDQVDYEDITPWPVTADGLGRSLERIEASEYGDDPVNWRASTAVGGSPGVFVAAPVAREDDGVGTFPAGFVLEPAYPNPFNPQTTLRFAVEKTQNVRLVLYNVLGRFQSVVYEGVVHPGETKEVHVNAGSLAGGTYVVRLEGEFVTASRQIVLVK